MRCAAAFDQIFLRVDFVGAVNCDVEMSGFAQVDERNAEFFRKRIQLFNVLLTAVTFKPSF